MYRDKIYVNLCRKIKCFWMGRLSIINMPNFLKLRGKFSVIQIEIPTGFVKVEKKNLTFIWKFLKVRMPRTFFYKKKRRSLLTEKCIKEACLKTLWCCYRNMQVCEWRICHVLNWTFNLLFSTLEQLCISALTATHYTELLGLKMRVGLWI